jgi:hypothetical protein
VLPCPVLPCPVLPCPVLPCPVLPCPVPPCPVPPCPVPPCPVLPCPVLPCPVGGTRAPLLQLATERTEATAIARHEPLSVEVLMGIRIMSTSALLRIDVTQKRVRRTGSDARRSRKFSGRRVEIVETTRRHYGLRRWQLERSPSNRFVKAWSEIGESAVCAQMRRWILENPNDGLYGHWKDWAIGGAADDEQPPAAHGAPGAPGRAPS